MKPYSVTIQMKAIEQYFCVIVLPSNLVLTFRLYEIIQMKAIEQFTIVVQFVYFTL